MTVTLAASPRYQWQGLSTDTKPTDSRVGVNDLFFAYDTGNLYIYNGTSWNLYAIGGGGGGGSGNYLGAYSSLAALDTAKPPASQTAGQVAYAPDSGLVVADGTLYNAIVTGVPQSGGIEGAPAIIRGTVYPARWPGVTQGSSIGSTLQAANLTALQAAIAYAGTNNLFFEFEPGTYEIIGGGLAIPYSNFTWVGSTRTYIVQYSNNVPVIHAGLTLGNANTTSRISIDGGVLKYSGTGVAGANALELTSTWMCAFSNLDIGDVYQGPGGFVSVPYNGVAGDTNAGCESFSNNFTNIRVKPWVSWAAVFNNPNGSTGDVWTNLYTGCGSNDAGVNTVTGGSLYFKNYKNLSIRQWNAEWMKTPCVAHLEQVVASSISQANIEGITLNPATSIPAFIYELVGSEIKFDGAEIESLTIQAANNVASAAVFGCANSTYIVVDDYEIQTVTKDSTHSPAFSLVQNFTAAGNTTPLVDLGLIHITGSAPYLDAFDSFTFSSGASGPVFSILRAFNFTGSYTLADATATVYVNLDGGYWTMTPTTARTITLAPQFAASTFPTLPRGVTRRIICASGSAGSIIVVNGGPGAGTIATLNAGATATVATVDKSGNWAYVGP